MIIIVSLHVGGVIVSSWIHRENLIVGMITGMKKNSNYPIDPFSGPTTRATDFRVKPDN